jgi:hypothetical protein
MIQPAEHTAVEDGGMAHATAGFDPLSQLRAQKQQYKDWFKQMAAAHARPVGVDIPHTLASADAVAIIRSIHQASVAQAHIGSLKTWAEAIREVERRLRDVAAEDSRAALLHGDVRAYEASMLAAVDALAAAVHAGSQVAAHSRAVPDVGTQPVLAEAAATIDTRMQQCRWVQCVQRHA